MALKTVALRLADALFANGWGFLLPYSAAYAVALALNPQAAVARVAFLGLHGLLLALLVLFAVRRLVARWRDGSFFDVGFWFWMLLLAGFLLAGAYLEFPGDTWEHLNRINAYRPETRVADSLWAHKFSYFWAWSFLSFVPPRGQRLALDLYSAAWQLLLAIQFFRFARRLGFPVAWSRLHVLGVIALFGNDVFGFFRYYAPGSTVVGYVAYLAAAIAALDLAEGRMRLRAACVLGATLPIMALNHIQELVLIVIFVAVVAVTYGWPRLGRPHRAAAVAIGTALYVAGYLIAPSFTSAPQGRLSRDVLWPFVNAFGCSRIWDTRLSFFHTIGVHGLLALVVAAASRALPPVVRALTLAPIALLLFPPFVLLMAASTSVDAIYRILFLLPTSFAIVAGAETIARRTPSVSAEDMRLRGALAVILGLGLFAAGPVYGKLRFQYFRPGPALSARQVDAAAQWLYEHRAPPERCVITSDAVTEWTVSAFLGTRRNVDKASDLRWIDGAYRPWRPWTAEDLLRYLRTLPSFRPGTVGCGFLVADPGPVAALPRVRSWVGEYSGHWFADAADMLARTPPGLASAAEALLPLGWRRTRVPPFYWYYEPGASPVSRALTPTERRGILLSP